MSLKLPSNSPIPPRTADTPTKLYKGGCHCGTFAYECRHPVLEDGFEVITCNCSLCVQRGSLLIYIFDPKDFTLTKGLESELTQYRFNRELVVHSFCPHCGCAFLSRMGPIAAVNARSISGIDVDKLTLKQADGRSL